MHKLVKASQVVLFEGAGIVVDGARKLKYTDCVTEPARTLAASRTQVVSKQASSPSYSANKVSKDRSWAGLPEPV